MTVLGFLCQREQNDSSWMVSCSASQLRLVAWAAAESIKGKSRGFIGAHELLANTVCVCVCLKVLLVKSWADPRTGGPQEGASSRGHVETVRRQ